MFELASISRELYEKQVFALGLVVYDKYACACIHIHMFTKAYTYVYVNQ